MRQIASGLVGVLIMGIIVASAHAGEAFQIRAGEDSLGFGIAIGEDERRGERPSVSPYQVKQKCAELLEILRSDAKGLKPSTEFNIESYLTVADAFEADGLMVQSVDVLSDLKSKLQALADVRAGHPQPEGLIETEEDILHYRDSHNIHAIDGKYMAGAQPTEKGYRWLKSKGVTTVINLRVPSEHERQIVEGLGMRYVHIPWADEQPPSVETGSPNAPRGEGLRRKGLSALPARDRPGHDNGLLLLDCRAREIGRRCPRERPRGGSPLGNRSEAGSSDRRASPVSVDSPV